MTKERYDLEERLLKKTNIPSSLKTGLRLGLESRCKRETLSKDLDISKKVSNNV